MARTSSKTGVPNPLLSTTCVMLITCTRERHSAWQRGDMDYWHPLKDAPCLASKQQESEHRAHAHHDQRRTTRVGVKSVPRRHTNTQARPSSFPPVQVNEAGTAFSILHCFPSAHWVWRSRTRKGACTDASHPLLSLLTVHVTATVVLPPTAPSPLATLSTVPPAPSSPRSLTCSHV